MTGRPRRFKLIFRLLTATLALLFFLFLTSFESLKDDKITFAGDASEQADIQKRQFPRDVVRRIIIYSIYVIYLNGKTLIRHLAILCGIHVRHRFSRFCINTTWDELSSEWGVAGISTPWPFRYPQPVRCLYV